MSKTNEVLDVTAVVCTLNAENVILDSLQSLVENGVSKIILVDANSVDRTRELAKPYVDQILTDPGKGLAIARNTGIQEVKTKYVLNWGADNVLLPGTIESMIQKIELGIYSGVSCKTKLLVHKFSYITWAMNIYKIARFTSGLKPTIGTPSLFCTELLLKFKFDPKMSWSDDGDLCDRLSSLGHKFYIDDSFVYEIGSDSTKMILYRWKNYGKSDYEIFSKYHIGWNKRRILKSLLHPLVNEIFVPLVRVNLIKGVLIFPFLVLICLMRYNSWIKHAKNKYL